MSGWLAALADAQIGGAALITHALGDSEEIAVELARLIDSTTSRLERCRRAVGGVEALRSLDDRPLPDEEMCWEGIGAGVAGRVAEVLAACDECCGVLLDVECRTACRRLLARVARRDPEALLRGRVGTAAAALCWSVAKVNGKLSERPGGMTAKDLVGHFGVSRSVSTRAATLLRAAGVPERVAGSLSYDGVLGDPGLLVSAERRRIIDARDRGVREAD